MDYLTLTNYTTTVQKGINKEVEFMLTGIYCIAYNLPVSVSAIKSDHTIFIWNPLDPWRERERDREKERFSKS